MKSDPRPAGTVAWVDLSTPDVDAAGAFYEELFGWTLESADTPMGRYVVGSVASGPVGGMMAPPEGQGPSAWTVFFGTDDIEASYALALASGATGLQPPMDIPDGGRIAAVADPVGAAVGIMRRPRDVGIAWGTSGAVAWAETVTSDVEVSRAFYEQVFGWSCSEGTNGYWVFDQHGEPVAGMMPRPPGMPEGVPSYWMPYFAVGLVENACERATQLGGDVIVPVMAVEQMHFAVIQDPAEATFGVLEASS
jgi:predicted enzyme related to lactoylglutathione lyase